MIQLNRVRWPSGLPFDECPVRIADGVIRGQQVRRPDVVAIDGGREDLIGSAVVDDATLYQENFAITLIRRNGKYLFGFHVVEMESAGIDNWLFFINIVYS